MDMHVRHILYPTFLRDKEECQLYCTRHLKKLTNAHTDLKHQLRHIGNKFLTHVEISAQEACYLILQMPLRMCSRTCAFINTSDPENRVFPIKVKRSS